MVYRAGHSRMGARLQAAQSVLRGVSRLHRRLMKALIRPLFIVFAIILIILSVRRGMNGGTIDYFSVGLAVATLILAFIVTRSEKDQDGAP